MSERLNFSAADVTAPTGREVATANEIQAMGVIGLDLTRAGRATLMNQIGSVLGIPPGGWSGQAKLFEGGDIRLAGFLRIMADARRAKLIASNLDRAGRFTHSNIMLAVVVAAREHHSALTATGAKLIDTYNEGGLDFLWDEKNRLGLPRSITKVWRDAGHFRNEETGNKVHPAEIPAYDQMMAYAAQIGASFDRNFMSSLRVEFGNQADAALAGASRAGVLVWKAYAFLSPGGTPYHQEKKLGNQLGQRFGHRSALGFYAQKARDKGRPPNLDDILNDGSLDRLEWVRSAKTRAAETLFLERLLKRVRELLPR